MTLWMILAVYGTAITGILAIVLRNWMLTLATACWFMTDSIVWMSVGNPNGGAGAFVMIGVIVAVVARFQKVDADE